MAILNKLTDVTYQDDIYDRLCARDTLGYMYGESMVVYGVYTDPHQTQEPELQKEIQDIIDMYELGARFMPDDMLYIFCKQSTENTTESTKFELFDSDGKLFTTVQDTECPMCSIFVNDDIVTIRKLCSLSHMGDLSIWVNSIVSAIRSYLKYDIIDKGTDIVTLLPPEKSSTDEQQNTRDTQEVPVYLIFFYFYIIQTRIELLRISTSISNQYGQMNNLKPYGTSTQEYCYEVQFQDGCQRHPNRIREY